MKDMPEMLWLDTVDSTSARLHRLESECDLPHGYAVAAYEQTAGRGQRGNHWHVESGANATVSVYLRPTAISAALQFDLLRMVALAVCEVLDGYLPEDMRGRLRLKWPNDIYFDNDKMGGILIENSLYGNRLGASVVGIGVNVRQRRWSGGAPNATSLALVRGCADRDLPEPREVCRAIAAACAATSAGEYDADILRTRYMARLWRGDGKVYRWLPGPLPSTYCGQPADALPFEAAIAGVTDDGRLQLRTADGTLLPPFAFKEVTPLL